MGALLVGKKSQKYFIWILLASALLGMLVALSIGLQQSAWFDEAYSIKLAQQSFSELIKLAALDAHPPVYYVILKIWGSIFGWSDFAMRSLSVLFYGASIVVAGLFVRRFFGVKTALCALPFLVLAPMLIRYGFEIRSYATASLIGVSATFALVRATEQKGWSRWWLIYAVLVTVGTLTLYYTVFLWFAHLFWLLRERGSLKKVTREPWFRAFCLSVLLFLPWLPIFILQMGNGALAPISQPMTLSNISGIFTFNTLYRPAWLLGGADSLLAVFAICAIFFSIWRAHKIIKKSQKVHLELLIFYMAVPVALVALVSLVSPLYVERYLSHVAIGGLMALGVSAGVLWQQKNTSTAIQVSLVGLTAVMSLGVANLSQVGNYNFQRLIKPEVESLTQTLEIDDYVVIADEPYIMTEIWRYVGDNDNLYFMAEEEDLSGGYAYWSGHKNHLNYDDNLSFDRVKHVYYDDEPEANLTKNGYVEQGRQVIGSTVIVTYLKN